MITLPIAIIMLMRVLQSLFNKQVSLKLPNGIKYYMTYTLLSKSFAAVFAIITICLSWDFSGFNSQMFLISAMSGICLALNTVFSTLSLKSGTMVLNSLFGTAGLVIPCILGIFVFDEPMNPAQWLCIAALFVAALLLVESSKSIMENFKPITLVYLLGTFVTNGFVMFFQKLFGELQPDGNVSAFSFLTFAIPSLILCVVLPFLRAKPKSQTSEQPEKFPRAVILYSIILAFAVFIIQQFVTILTSKLSAAVLFAFVNGGATVIATIVGAVVYKERITVKSVLGVVIGIASLIVIKIFE